MVNINVENLKVEESSLIMKVKFIKDNGKMD